MRSLSAVLATAVLVLATPGLAGAASKTVKDDADDADGPALDISSATLNSKQGVLKIRAEVDVVDSGGMVVFLQPQGSQELLAYSDYDAQAGTLENGLRRGNKKVTCKGLNVAWNTGKGSVSFRIPASCIDGGDYGKVRFKLFSEKSNGADNDFAPEDKNGYWKWSPYVARG